VYEELKKIKVSNIIVIILLSVMLYVVQPALASSSWSILTKDQPDGELFKLVWDGEYWLVSDEVFPLTVYVVSLPGVGNYRLSNHSDVVKGVRQGAAITPDNSQVKELVLLLGYSTAARLNVSVSCVLVEDWGTYRTLVESANNTIIVNTHDEYLPVPDDYTPEAWTDTIADFMLNRWGTWVHAGGYPLYKVWHQNGTTMEWGEQGFKRLMSHVDKGDVDCQPPPGSETTKASAGAAMQMMGRNWLWWSGVMLYTLGTIAVSDMGNPLRLDDFGDQITFTLFRRVYGNKTYYPGAVIRFGLNESVLNFGVYVHLGSWRFYDGNDNPLKDIDGNPLHDFAAGFIATAAAIYQEFRYATTKLYGEWGSATEAIQLAEEQGRTVGLADARTLFQKGLDAFAAFNYKAAGAYAVMSKAAADEATVPSTLPQTIVAVDVVAAVSIGVGVGAYYKLNKKKRRQEEN
jgi:hypothetical protein